MKYTEVLLWILDSMDGKNYDEEKYRKNIEFVHSLGLRCDCVGWCKLNLSDSRADEILFEIEKFCKANGWGARGIYSRTYSDYESLWYELVPEQLKDTTIADSRKCKSAVGGSVEVLNIRAHREMKASPKCYGDFVLVPERFRDACIRHGISDVDFCYASDLGRYAAEQYFHLYSNNQIPKIATDRGIKSDKRRIAALGGYLPKIAKIFYDIQGIDLQDCYLESDMPSCNIAHAYLPGRYSFVGKNTFLIHKDFADILIREKALPKSALRPALTVKDAPLGYAVDNTAVMARPALSYINESIKEYEKLKSTPRPARAVSEKDALKILRSAKRERKEDFKRAMPKAFAEKIADTKYAPLLPYYSVANGGFLSDEYELFSYEDAVAEDRIFSKELQAEGLLEKKIDGAVIAKCADGDRILLCEDGGVIRISHEEPAAVEEWEGLSQFIADTTDI
ncbi:MAG: hypothetical protein IJY65_05610 [Clostridia bacterium]|nr:hypothetical protein [Clostridia bacterium]